MLLLCCSYVALIGNGTYNGLTTEVQRTYSKQKVARILTNVRHFSLTL